MGHSLTARYLDQLKSHGQRYEVFGALVPGLALRVSAASRKTFTLYYCNRGRMRRLASGVTRMAPWKRGGRSRHSTADASLTGPIPQARSTWSKAIRINEIIDNQVRSLRKRQLIGSFETKLQAGTYWSVRWDITNYEVPHALPCPPEKTILRAEIGTRLQRLEPVVQERLINWGYAICDAAMRKWVDASLAKPSGFPYPTSGIG